ncbi:MAG TPA: glycine zipper family protein [Alphaproteobacteria bacterium]|nr:glycine zipper family protein [Alphaproteobacteria bacterium]
MRYLVFVFAAVVLAGCADTYHPIVDKEGVDQSAYQRDLGDCREYARRVNPTSSAAEGGLIGGAIGAAAGAVVGALTVGVGRGAAIGAAGGGTAGLLRGGLRGLERQKRVIRRCMHGRGYRVLE